MSPKVENIDLVPEIDTVCGSKPLTDSEYGSSIMASELGDLGDLLSFCELAGMIQQGAVPATYPRPEDIQNHFAREIVKRETAFKC
ncbi:jg21228 [Pararge aegeria aegeria]|uniref:Jg21228 protein n=1 Tax=Pararge aegeria aegeria TaxID=348720 RepID=A0A8S4R8N3_9NEOP|nr:jg21228 [Pararge aegeria aegeria]